MSFVIKALITVSLLRGFAAAQCGKALPYRMDCHTFRGCASEGVYGGVASIHIGLDGKAKPYRTVLRQSRGQ